LSKLNACSGVVLFVFRNKLVPSSMARFDVPDGCSVAPFNKKKDVGVHFAVLCNPLSSLFISQSHPSVDNFMRDASMRNILASFFHSNQFELLNFGRPERIAFSMVT
jgi:hypothetical protein